MASRISNVNRFEERTVTGQLSYELEPYTISMLVIGTSGVGKSMFCNFMAQKESLFAESCGMESETDRVEHCVKKFGKEKLLLLDSPGFNDPVKSNEEIIEKISETAILTRDGVDVIAIMVNPTSRFSTNDKNTLKIIEGLGGNMWKHAFIIFNNASKIERGLKKKPEEYIKQMEDSAKCPKELKEMLKEVGHRYICVESVDRCGDDNYWQFKSKEVVEMIISLRNRNKGKRYQNKIMSMGLEGYKIVLRLEKETIAKNKEIERQKGIDQDKDIQELQKKISNVQIDFKKNENGSKDEMKPMVSEMMKFMKETQEMTNKLQLENLQRQNTAQQETSEIMKLLKESQEMDQKLLFENRQKQNTTQPETSEMMKFMKETQEMNQKLLFENIQKKNATQPEISEIMKFMKETQEMNQKLLFENIQKQNTTQPETSEIMKLLKETQEMNQKLLLENIQKQNTTQPETSEMMKFMKETQEMNQKLLFENIQKQNATQPETSEMMKLLKESQEMNQKLLFENIQKQNATQPETSEIMKLLKETQEMNQKLLLENIQKQNATQPETSEMMKLLKESQEMNQKLLLENRRQITALLEKAPPESSSSSGCSMM